MFRLILAMTACLLLAGCVALPSRTPARDPMPPLHLAPAALGRELALQQKLEFTFGGRREVIEALLEVDAQEVRLLLHSAGQPALRLRWDGHALIQTRADWLPDALSAQRVLDDLQLVYWPLASLRAVLPAGWQIEDVQGVRRLHQGQEEVATIEYPSVSSARLVQHRQGYRLDVQSVAVSP